MTHQAYSTDTSQITSVWSSHGHRFIGEDENYVSCLTCGALYQELAHADDLTRGAYLANNGGEPTYCTHNTSMGHGDPTEQDPDIGLENFDHDCNCLFCA